MATWKLSRLIFGNEEFILSEGEEITIGRGNNNKIILSSFLVSRNHCVLSVKRDEVVITDLESLNGIFVGPKKIPSSTPNKLQAFDVIGFGLTVDSSFPNVDDADKYIFELTREERKPLVDRIIFENEDVLEEALLALEKGLSQIKTSASPILDLNQKRKINQQKENVANGHRDRLPRRNNRPRLSVAPSTNITKEIKLEGMDEEQNGSHALVNKSHKLTVTATRADSALETSGEITENSTSMIDRSAFGSCASLSFSVAECCDSTPPARVAVKPEPESEEPDDTQTDDEHAGDGAAEGHQPVAGSSRNSTHGEPQRDPRAQSADTRHQCHVCLRQFQYKSYLQRHLRTHTNEKPLECNVCHSRFADTSALNRHARTHTGEKPFECNHCQKQFSRKVNLEEHLRTHTGEKPFECNHCKKQFSLKNTLKIHLRTHTGEKPFECNHCKKQFSQKGSIETHLRTHTGEKPFECKVCSRRFAAFSALHRHLRTHTGEKPHNCNYCKKQFSNKGDLVNHLRTHTGEKPYKCNHCKKHFSQKSNLKKHLRRMVRVNQ